MHDSEDNNTNILKHMSIISFILKYGIFDLLYTIYTYTRFYVFYLKFIFFSSGNRALVMLSFLFRIDPPVGSTETHQ